jgi:phage gp45-like
MKYRVMVVLCTALATSAVLADLKPNVIDCNAKKATRNAAMDATVGVSGNCDADKVAKKTKDNVADDARDAVNLDHDKKKSHHGKGKLGKNRD